MLVGVRKRARAFRDEVDQLTQGRPIFGEETHLLKKRYANELVDTGRTVGTRVAATQGPVAERSP